MTLKNLADIGRLKQHSATAKELARLLESAVSSLEDAKRKENHATSRFDLAYKSLMQSALAALMANGFRRARNLADYEGNPPEDRLVAECIEAAEQLLEGVRAWLKKNRPDLTKHAAPIAS